MELRWVSYIWPVPSSCLAACWCKTGYDQAQTHQLGSFPSFLIPTGHEFQKVAQELFGSLVVCSKTVAATSVHLAILWKPGNYCDLRTLPKQSTGRSPEEKMHSYGHFELGKGQPKFLGTFSISALGVGVKARGNLCKIYCQGTGRHALWSFLATNLTQNYFLIARMLSF